MIGIRELINNNVGERDYYQLLLNYKWPKIITCPYCGGHKVWVTNRGYTCQPCGKKFTLMTGTIYCNTKLPLSYIMRAYYWYLAEPTKGHNSHLLARRLKITQRSAWLIIDKINMAFIYHNNEPYINLSQYFIIPPHTINWKWRTCIISPMK